MGELQNEDLIGKARKLIAAAHKFLHPDAKGEMPKVLDPFAGGGAIPLEALRLGCEAHAIDLNPVAHLIELCMLVYPQKFGQPKSRPTHDEAAGKPTPMSTRRLGLLLDYLVLYPKRLTPARS